MTYKRKLATLIVFLIVVLFGALLPTRALAACDATTIDGSYGYRLNTFFGPLAVHHFDPLSSFFPSAFAGQIVFDSATTSISGSRVGNSGGQAQTHTFTGTYSVNSDCTGTVHQVLDNGAIREYAIAIVQGGVEIEFADTSSPDFGIVGEGVAKKAPATCDATTIAGSYGFRFNLLLTTGLASSHPQAFLHVGAFEPGALAGQIVFDSTTNPPSISGFRAGSTGGHAVSSTFIGTYSVNADCTVL